MPPIDDSEIKRVLVISAHPDDSDFGAAGTIAQWINKGIEVAYVFALMEIKAAKHQVSLKKRCPQFVSVNKLQQVRQSSH